MKIAGEKSATKHFSVLLMAIKEQASPILLLSGEIVKKFNLTKRVILNMK